MIDNEICAEFVIVLNATALLLIINSQSCQKLKMKFMKKTALTVIKRISEAI